MKTDEQRKNYCKCGCGAEIALDKKYAPYHHLRDPEVLKKRDETTLKRHGVTNISKRDDIKEQKSVKWQAQKPEIIAKYRKTMQKKYGVNNIFQVPEIKEIISHKCDEKRKETVKKIQEGRRNTHLMLLDRRLAELSLIRTFTDVEYNGTGRVNKYPFKCLICGNEFSGTIDDGEAPVCRICNPDLRKIGTSELERTLTNAVQAIVNYPLVVGSRTIIPPEELDIFASKHNIAIEFDGIYWHSDLAGKTRNYHKNKTNRANKLGIRLIHIFENEWVFKHRIVISRLRNMFGKSRYKIHGRKCKILEIERKVSNRFLNKYHIQGDASASIRLGAFYKNRLIAVMTFVRTRHDKMGGYELLRFASIFNFSCVGVAGKLLKAFERKYHPTRLITYADLRWSEGNLYKTLGFTHKHTSNPNYFYFKDNLELKSRIKFQKHKLSDILNIFDQNKTEWENMKANGWNRIWDCGNMVFEKIY